MYRRALIPLMAVILGPNLDTTAGERPTIAQDEPSNTAPFVNIDADALNVYGDNTRQFIATMDLNECNDLDITCMVWEDVGTVHRGMQAVTIGTIEEVVDQEHVAVVGQTWNLASANPMLVAIRELHCTEKQACIISLVAPNAVEVMNEQERTVVVSY